VDVACGQAGDSEMKKMISKSYRQFLAESDVVAGAGLLTEKFPAASEIVVIRDGEEETVETETTDTVGFHAQDFRRLEGGVVLQLRIIEIRFRSQAEGPLQ
jgi:hypothetical protein